MATQKRDDDKSIPEKVGDTVKEVGRHIKEAAENLSGKLDHHEKLPRDKKGPVVKDK